MRHELLANGVEVVLKENHFTPAVALQAWVGVGSLHEGEHERGMAHFLEHMLFKGTAKRGPGEIAATVEGCGGDINAYTTFDQTVFYLTMASEHASLGVDLLCDAFHSSTLDEAEFAREREVILEEIRRSQDSPGSRLGRQVFQLMFAGSEAGRPILGTSESVAAFKQSNVYAFYRRWYTPDNVRVIAVGDFIEDEMLAQIKATFGALPPAKIVRPLKMSLPHPVQDFAEWPRVSILKGDFKQPRLEVVYPAPALEELDSTALDLAAFALGSGELSRLLQRLRDRDASVTAVGASVYSPHFGGLFEVSGLTSLESLAEAITGIGREVAALHGLDEVTPKELARARANLKADRIAQEETVDGQARSLGYGMRTSHKLLYDDVYTTLINEMPLVAVTGAVKRWLRPEKATVVVLVPDGTELGEEAIREAFRRGVEQASGAGTQGGQEACKSKPFAANGTGALTTQVEELRPGLRLVYRHNPNVELFTLTAATEGGLRGEDKESAGLYHALFSSLGLASETYDFASVMDRVEGYGASLEGFSGKDSAGFHLQCLTEQASDMLSLWQDLFLRPRIPDLQWQSLKRETEQGLLAQEDSPSNLCVRKFQEQLYGEHPYRYPVLGTLQSIKEFSAEGVLEAYRTILSSGHWVISVASTLPLAEVKELVLAGTAGFRPQAERRIFKSELLVSGGRPGNTKLHKDREQTHIVYGFPGLTWADADRYALDVLITVLGGHGGRLFRKLRDEQSLAYSVSPLVTYGCHPGMVGSYIACAPSKADHALDAMISEMMALTEVEISDAELARACHYMIGSHEMGLQKSDAQTSTMALMELYGFGYDDFLTYPQKIAKVTRSAVLQVARKLFLSARAISVSVGPNG